MSKSKKPTVGEMAFSFFRDFGFKEMGGTEKQILRCWRGDFYRWDSGIYKKITKDELKTRVVIHLTKMGIETTTDVVNNVSMNLNSQAYLQCERVPDTWLSSSENITIPSVAIVTETEILTFMPNGDVDFVGNTPDFFALGKVPYSFNPDAICERWLLFLNEVTVGNKQLQRLLQQWAGYLLIPSQEYQCFMLLQGDAATGKGTFTRAIEGMLGQENCSAVPLRRFINNFALYQTYGMKLNVAGDAEEELTPQIEAIIKTWVGKDNLDYERKYSTGFTARPTAKLMIGCNSIPTFTDKSMGTWRRLKIVPFSREDTSIMDTKLDDKLDAELPGILNWAIEGLKDLRANGGFVVPDKSQELWEQQKEESNPAGMFLRDNFVWESDAYGSESLGTYTQYRRWCKAMGYIPMSDRTFGKEVRRAFPKVIKKKLGRRGHRVSLYMGLRMKEEAELRNIPRKTR